MESREEAEFYFKIGTEVVIARDSQRTEEWAHSNKDPDSNSIEVLFFNIKSWKNWGLDYLLLNRKNIFLKCVLAVST